MKEFSRFMPQTQSNLTRGKVAAHFVPLMNANYCVVVPPSTRRTAIGWYPKVISYGTGKIIMDFYFFDNFTRNFEVF